ncbi:class IV lanthionine synthetase LanL [Kitasatospora atroaurantiaca]|nr:class IV lanthionine synthetase LanL [Kitasatospora atroaurantiaca]
MGAGTPLRTAGGPGSVGDAPDADGTLLEVARAAVAGTGSRGGGGDWGFTVEGFWCTARPAAPEIPEQGWKLHVSAASEVAVEVLAAVAAVIAEDPCAFKFAADREKLHELNSRNSERGSAGKFITVYPADEEQFRRIAEELHRATESLPGPTVLSDRPYAPGSRVHYRYGAFAGRAELGNDGAYRSMLYGPDGARIEDVRTASYRCPPWAVDPVEGRGSTKPSGARPGPGGVLLGGRYALTAAVRHGAKGGVFLGRDTASGAEVVVKQARAHIEVDRSGTEARAALRHEARLLARLDGQELTPRPVQLLEQGDSLFLVQERIPGQPLGSWVAGRLRRDGAPDVAWAEAGPMALALVELLERVHAEGLVLRDLAPGNVMVRPDGRLRLIDLELAAPVGTTAGSAGTPGYRAPEQGPVRLCSPAEFSADLYAMGGLFFLLATGHDPLLPEDLPRARPVAERLGRWLALAAREGGTARRLAPIVLGLRAEEPGQRWSLARVRAALADSVPLQTAPPAGEPLLDRLLHDGLRHLALTATPQRRDRLWPTVPAGQLTDPCNVQHGAAGVLAVLARAACAPLPGPVRESARDTAKLAAEWIERRCAAEPVVLPGLHFGRSGTAWALLDAAEALADPALADRAAALARRVQLTWPNPDVCHGAAGAGFLQLRLYRSTGSSEFLDRAAACAHGLLAAAQREPYGTVWPVPRSFDSSLAGVTHLGYAHGVAGVGAFLLAAAEATGDDELLTSARQAAGTLAATVRREGAAGWWPQSEGDPESVRLAHWCSGSSGVGSFLVRLWQATGDSDAYELALAAGQAVLDGRWHSGVCACHGLAGNGEYLLDLAEATGERRFRSGAEELARLIAARAALRDGRLILPDETGTGCTPAYGTGTSGALAFLLRLRHGGPRIWLDPQPLGAGLTMSRP